MSVSLVLGGIADAVFDLASAAARKSALCERCSPTTPSYGLLVSYSLLQNHFILQLHL